MSPRLLLRGPCATTPRRFLSHRVFAARRISSPSAALVAPPSRRYEQVSVPCRSNGSIQIDILPSSTPSSPILIYLPSGPVLPDHNTEEDAIISILGASSGATIARINYRASSQHQFPTPLHDVLFGYDWIQENLLVQDDSRPRRLARLGVCGELLGGSLATLLALTECKLAHSRIGAAAVNNPILDWVFPDDMPAAGTVELPEPLAPEETSFPADQDMMTWWVPQESEEPATVKQKPRKRVPKAPPPTSWQLHGDNPVIPALTLSAERDMLFRRPEDYLDRFASPIHFFRSPHATVIYPQHEDLLASLSPTVQAVDLLDVETRMSVEHFDTFGKSCMPADLPRLVRCRAYARIYPPAAHNLDLPLWHIATGSQSPLMDQASELSRLVRRSIARQTLRNRAGRIRYHDSAEKENYEAYANGRVALNTVEGVGLWSQWHDNPGWRLQVEQMGAWMKKSL
ncbi:Alpha/Beta hydrolase protein, partial [Massariosphaeria phaeospora]